MEILKAEKLDAIIRGENLKDVAFEEIDDAILRRFAKYVHVIRQLEAKASKNDNTMTNEELFYSRYYWFCQFKERYFKLYGHDEGLEQQSFKMLTEYAEIFPERIDWALIERIENNCI